MRNPPRGTEGATPQMAESTALWAGPIEVEVGRGGADAARRWLDAAAAPLDQLARDRLVDLAAEARLVLLGESTHGTSEFYTLRGEITRALIERGEISFVAVEGDWSALALLNAYVRGDEMSTGHGDAASIMSTFARWPVWMWANEEFADFVEWLHTWNAALPVEDRVGLHGLDVYDAGASGAFLMRTLREVDGAPLYPCMRRFWSDRRAYARALEQGQPSCESEVRATYDAFVEGNAPWMEDVADDERFEVIFNALVLKGAERHYRSFATRGGAEGWNSRASFFFRATLALLEWYGADARGIVWAHNTHVGDARATSMATQGQVNLGQEAREALPDETFVLGFATIEGEVMAGTRWGEAPQVMPVPRPHDPSTWDAILAEIRDDDWAVVFRGTTPPDALRETRAQRAIGVIYAPASGGAWVETQLAARYDALIVLQQSVALNAIP